MIIVTAWTNEIEKLLIATVTTPEGDTVKISRHPVNTLAGEYAPVAIYNADGELISLGVRTREFVKNNYNVNI